MAKSAARFLGLIMQMVDPVAVSYTMMMGDIGRHE